MRIASPCLDDAGAGYGAGAVNHPYQGYSATGYANLGGAASYGGSMMQSTGSFTSTPQFAFYPETGGGGSSTALGTSNHASAAAAVASGTGARSRNKFPEKNISASSSGQSCPQQEEKKRRAVAKLARAGYVISLERRKTRRIEAYP